MTSVGLLDQQGPMYLRPKKMHDYQNLASGVTSGDDEKEDEDILKQKPNAKVGKTSSIPCDTNGQYLCNLCDFKSKYVQNVHAHKRRHAIIGKKSHVCRDCRLNFLTKQKLQTHQCKNQATRGCMYKCLLCNTTSLHKGNIVRHLKKHQCYICMDIFPKFREATRHVTVCKAAKKTVIPITPDKLIHAKCTLCSSEFTTHIDFSGHVCNDRPAPAKKATVRKHPTDEKTGKMKGWDEELMLYCCDKCEFSSPSPLALANHLKNHPDIDPPLVKSPFLQKKRIEYAIKHELKRKRPRMCGWNPTTFQYDCNQCEFSTVAPVALVNHKKSHEKAMKYSLPVLNPIIVNSSSGNVKKKPRPSNGNVFTCLQCNLKFQSHAHLTIHLSKVHEGPDVPTESSIAHHTLEKGDDKKKFTSIIPTRPSFSLLVEGQDYDPKELCCSICDFNTIDIDVLTHHLKCHQKVTVPEGEYETEDEPQDLSLCSSETNAPSKVIVELASSTSDQSDDAHNETKSNNDLDITFDGVNLHDLIEHGQNAKIDHGQNANIDRGQNVNIDRGQNANIDRGQNVNIDHGQNTNIDRGQNANIDRGQNANIDHGQNTNTDHGQNTNIDHGQNVNIDRGQNANIDHGQNANIDHGQIANIDHGQKANIDHGQNTNIDHGQNTNIDHGQNANIDHGQNANIDHGQNANIGHGQNVNIDHGQNANIDHGQNPNIDHGQNPNIDHGQNPNIDHGQNPNIDHGQNLDAIQMFDYASQEIGEKSRKTDEKDWPENGRPSLESGMHKKGENYGTRDLETTIAYESAPPVSSDGYLNKEMHNEHARHRVQSESSTFSMVPYVAQQPYQPPPAHSVYHHQYSPRPIIQSPGASHALVCNPAERDHDQYLHREVDTARNASMATLLPGVHGCSVCKIFFQEFKAFHMHLQLHCPDNPWMCCVCKNTYNTSVAFLGHLHNH